MKKSILNIAITTATAISIAACSSGSDVAGIGGSGVAPVGFTSSGTITGFGSVFVNGVEFFTSSNTTYTVEDDSASSESALRVGMVVFVDGSIDDNGTTGTATSIRYDDSLEGPVSSITDAPPATSTNRSRELIILGTTVIVNEATTVIDNSSSFTFDTLAAGTNIEVSGFPNVNGAIVATYIEEKDPFLADQTIVEIKGIIEGSDGSTQFNIGNLTVNVTSNTDTSDLLGGLANGTFVEVKGTLSSPTSTSLIATKVEPEDNSLGDDRNEVEIEGIITRYVDDSDFDIDGYPVDASNAIKEPSGLVLKENMLIEAEGAVVNGILVAKEIESEDEEAEVSALASNVNLSNNTFELSLPAGQSITVIVNDDTEYEDKDTDSPTFSLNEIMANDYIEVEGVEIDNNGTIAVLASKVERDQPDDTILQGIVTAGSGTSSTITVLGVDYDVSGSTVFYDIDEQSVLSQSEFFDTSNAQLGVSVIKIKDEISGGNATGTADEVELERR
jgi:co-chaperonin GroES (HSP10)